MSLLHIHDTYISIRTHLHACVGVCFWVDCACIVCACVWCLYELKYMHMDVIIIGINLTSQSTKSFVIAFSSGPRKMILLITECILYNFVKFYLYNKAKLSHLKFQSYLFDMGEIPKLSIKL